MTYIKVKLFGQVSQFPAITYHVAIPEYGGHDDANEKGQTAEYVDMDRNHLAFGYGAVIVGYDGGWCRDGAAECKAPVTTSDVSGHLECKMSIIFAQDV